MTTRTDAQLARLGSLSQTEIRTEWQAVFEEPAPDVPVSLLQRALAHRIQEQAHGGLAPAAQRLLEMLSRDPDAKLTEPRIRPKPGSRLIREWNGKVHTVEVTAAGLVYDQRRFTSLSHVAREITGAHWSGPRFFGLKKRSSPPRNVAAGG